MTSMGISICTGRGPRTAEDREGARQYRRELVRAHQCVTERRHVGGEAALRGKLVQPSSPHAQLVHAVDARDHQHRHGIAVGLAHRRQNVGHPGPGDDEAHAGLAGHARVPVRHESRALFVPRGDVPDARRGKSPVELHGMHPRNAEYGIDAEIFQELHEKLAACQHGGFPSGSQPANTAFYRCGDGLATCSERRRRARGTAE